MIHRAVELPRVGVEAHVRHVGADVTGVLEGVHGLPEEEEARVLTGPVVHERHVRSDSGHAQPVDRRGDRPGDVRAVPVLVHVVRVLTGMIGILDALAVDERDVGRPVPAQRPVEVRRDVGVRSVDARVDHGDDDVLRALLNGVGAVGCRIDHAHVPLPVGEEGLLETGGGLVDGDSADAGPCGAALALDAAGLLPLQARIRPPDHLVTGDARESGLLACGLRKPHVLRGDEHDPECLLRPDDLATDPIDCGLGRLERDAVVVANDVLPRQFCARCAGRRHE